MADDSPAELSQSQLELLRYLEDLQQNNPSEYEQMTQQLAAQQAEKRGASQSVTVLPTPGFVAKTRSVTAKGRKVFVNLCTSELIDECSPMDASAPLPDGAPPPSDDEYRIRIPMSAGAPREDLDKGGEACTVYDVIFHPSTVEEARKDKGFRTFMMQLIASQLHQKHGDELSDDFAFPKLANNYKGLAPLPQFIRAKPKLPASEGGGFEPAHAPAAPLPIIEEVPTSAADADAAAAALPAPAYVLRPLTADGAPLDDDDDEAEGGVGAQVGGDLEEEGLARAPARLEVKIHLPALATGARGARAAGARGRRAAPESALELIDVQVSAWDMRVLVAGLYSLALELPHAVHATAEDACLELERCVLTVWLRVLGSAEALEAADACAASHEASKVQAEAWEAQLNKEARARKARKLLDERRKAQAAERAAAEARREAEAAARRESQRAGASGEGGEGGEGAAGSRSARGPRAEAAPAVVRPIELVSSIMFELE